MDLTSSGFALDVENCLPEFCTHGVHGFEGEVLEYLFADFVPEVLLRVQLRGIGWQEQERDVVGDRKQAALMVGGFVSTA
jgi:hypothetical protein